MKVTELAIPGPLLIEPRVFGDHRGYFLETYQAARYQEAGVPASFVQDNLSFSQAGVLRGLHLQHPGAQGKLVSVLQGRIFDVVVDLRPGSESFGRWLAFELDGESKCQLWIPEGFAHGFLTLEPDTLFCYKCTAPYAPEYEHTLAYDDPTVGVEWPPGPYQLSAKDQAGSSLAELKQLLAAAPSA